MKKKPSKIKKEEIKKEKLREFLQYSVMDDEILNSYFLLR